MEGRHYTHRIPLGVVAGLSAVVVAVGGSTAWWTWHSLTSVESSPTVTSTDSTTTAPETPIAAVEQTVQLYWLTDTGRGLELSPYDIQIQGESQPEDILTTAFDSLLTGPDSAPDSIDAFSTIPPGTQLLALQVEPDGIHVDLSNEFGLGGGSAAMSGRLGQVLYTATALDPDAPVWISVEGQPLKVLGGEGLIVEQPMTRSDFEREFQL